MNDRMKNMWNEAVENIDDKYIGETAETIVKHSGKEVTLTEIIVEKPVEDKHAGIKRAVRIAFSSAAALAVIIGGSVFLRNVEPLSENPLSSDTTASSPTTTPIETTTVIPEDIGEEVWDTYPPLEIDEDNCNYDYIDCGTFGIHMVHYKDSGKILLYAMDIESGETLTTYDTGIKAEPLGELTPDIELRRFKSGTAISLSVPVPDADGSGVNFEHRLYECQTGYVIKAFSRTDIAEPFVDRTDSSTFTYDKGNSDAFRLTDNKNEKQISYTVDFENRTVSQTVLFPMDVNMTRIIESENTEFTFDSKIFEDVFYGCWESAFRGGNDIYFSYYTDKNHQLHDIGGLFAETDDGWYMRNVSGGEVSVYYVPKEDKNHLYVYGGGTIPAPYKNQYYCVYERAAEQDFYGTEEYELNRGTLSSYGINKLEELTGFYPYYLIMTSGKITDSSGNDWRYYSDDLIYGYGLFNLISRTDSKIKFSMRFLPYDTALENYSIINNNLPPFHYLTLIAEKTDGKWELTEVHEFDPSLEQIEENFSFAGDLIYNEGGNIEVDYYPTSDGYYFAHRKLYPASGGEYGEYYYFNGVEWSWINDSVGVSSPVLADDIFYFVFEKPYGDTVNTYVGLIYRGKEENLWPKIIPTAYSYSCPMNYIDTKIDSNGESTKLTVDEISEYKIITVTLDDRNYYFAHTYIPFTGDSLKQFDEDTFVMDEDRIGFKGEINGEVIDYRPDSLERMVETLNKNADRIWIDLKVCMPPVDWEITYNYNGMEYGYLCEYDELEEYLGYTFDNVNEILFPMFTDSVPPPMVQDGNNVYALEGARGTNIDVGDITYTIGSQTENYAELVYTAYRMAQDGADSDEVYATYTIPVIKTENGWRLCRFYSVK